MGGGRCIRFVFCIMHASSFSVRRRWFRTYFSSVPELEVQKIKYRMQVRAPPSPPLVVSSGIWMVVGCRCRFGLGKMPGSGVKMSRQGPRRALQSLRVHARRFWRWNAFAFISAGRMMIVVVVVVCCGVP